MRHFTIPHLALILLVCQLTLAAPDKRPRRDTQDQAESPNPLEAQDAVVGSADRGKRSGENPFGGKNAVLGFVFGKINSLIDQKTKFIDTLDKQNVEKNKQHNIETPKPITSFQDLISAVITPKITAITSKIGSLSGSFLGGSSGGGGSSGSDGSSSSGGLGNIVSSLLRLSGPLLTSSAGGASGGGSGGSNSVDDEDFNDDDFN